MCYNYVIYAIRVPFPIVYPSRTVEESFLDFFSDYSAINNESLAKRLTMNPQKDAPKIHKSLIVSIYNISIRNQENA